MGAEVMKMREENPSQEKKNKIANHKWFLPGVYIACVALVMIGAFWYQSTLDTPNVNPNSSAQISDNTSQPSLEVNKPLENFVMPLADSDKVVIKGQFYDINGDEGQQEAALVKYGDTYQPNTGIDYALKDNASFDVLAAMSGTVTRVQNDALLGNVVEIEHEKGLVTQYSSITNIAVKAGDKVMQGTSIAKAGRSEINKDAAVHVHFEMRKDGTAVNPNNFLKKPLSSLKAWDLKDIATSAKEQMQKKQQEKTTDTNPAAPSNQEEKPASQDEKPANQEQTPATDSTKKDNTGSEQETNKTQPEAE